VFSITIVLKFLMSVRFFLEAPHKHFQKKKGKKRKQVASKGLPKAGYKSPLVGVAQPLCARLWQPFDNLAALFSPFLHGNGSA
jgi:hypothetical protein